VIEDALLSEIAVVYVSWNTREELGRSLNALRVPGGQGLEFVVVDNASSDGTVVMLEEGFPGVRVIANPDNRGFATAFNQGWRATDRPFVLLMNPDVILPVDALRALCGCIRAHPPVGVIAPVLVDEDGGDTESARPFPPLTLRLLGGELPDHGEALDLSGCPGAVAVHWLMGACCLFRREALEATGGFDEGFFLYGEDIDWALRAWRAGWTVAQLSGLTAVHLGHRSAVQVAPMITTMRRHDGYFRYLAQAHGPWAARGNYLWWLLRAGLAAMLLAPAAALNPALRPRLSHEWGRLWYCLTHLGRPLARAQFGRNHAPADSSQEER
jgi:GT2 family glycosyltransferase